MLRAKERHQVLGSVFTLTTLLYLHGAQRPRILQTVDAALDMTSRPLLLVPSQDPGAGLRTLEN